MSGFKILDPTVVVGKLKTQMAPRLETLNGARFGVIWNSQPHGDTIIKYVIDKLSKKWNCELTLFLEKDFIGNKAPDSYFDQLVAARVNVAIAGVGD